MVTTEIIPVGFGSEIVVKTDEQPDSTTKVVTFRGKTKRKTFRGEVSHHDAQRWANDLILPVIHGAKDGI